VLEDSTLNSAHHRASFLQLIHSTAVAGCLLCQLPHGHRLDDEAVTAAVGLRLGLDLCVRHQSHCRFQVDRDQDPENI